jgi:glutamate dehydrogenase
MARAALRADGYAVHPQLTPPGLRATGADEPAPARIATWEEGDAVVVARAASTLEDICADETGDLARVSVGLRVVRGLLSG